MSDKRDLPLEAAMENLRQTIKDTASQQQIIDRQATEIVRLQAAFKFITDWHEAKWRNRLNPQHARDAHKESWERCLAKAKEVRGE